MLASWPTTRPTLAFLQFFLGPENAPFSGRLLLRVFDPADEFVTSKRCDVGPRIDWRTHESDELLYLPERDEDVSLLMAYTLPFLSDSPWELRDELETAIRARAEHPAPDHFVAVLEFLRDRFSATSWVERTGGSLPHAAPIVAAWPNAQFVMLHRDPVETALSMRTGSFFRLCLATEAGRRSSWLDPEFADPVALAAMLERWANQADETIRMLPAEQVFNITYERLIGTPREALDDLLRFVLGRQPSSDDDRWARQQAVGVSPPPAHGGELSDADLDDVRQACPRTIERWIGLRQRNR